MKRFALFLCVDTIFIVNSSIEIDIAVVRFVFFFFFFFFFFHLLRGLGFSARQDYFINFEPSQLLGGAKMGDFQKSPPDHHHPDHG